MRLNPAHTHSVRLVSRLSEEKRKLLLSECFAVVFGGFMWTLRFWMWCLVQRFKDRRLPLHTLINNAAVMLVSESRTEDAVEACFAIIYLGHFLLTHLLLDRPVHSGRDGSCSRVIRICTAFSSSHEAYAWSKLAQLLFTSHLHCAPEPSGSAVTVDPGLVDTGLYGRLARHAHRPVAWLFFKTPAEGAAAAVSPELEGVDGCVVSEGHQIQSSTASLRQDLQARLWRKTSGTRCFSHMTHNAVASLL